jgi:hypothetical protein
MRQIGKQKSGTGRVRGSLSLLTKVNLPVQTGPKQTWKIKVTSSSQIPAKPSNATSTSLSMAVSAPVEAGQQMEQVSLTTLLQMISSSSTLLSKIAITQRLNTMQILSQKKAANLMRCLK